jgi:hypothetical protein
MIDSNPELKPFYESKQTQVSVNWWAAMTTEFKTWKKIWEVLPKKSIPATRDIIGVQWVYAKRRMENSDYDVLQKVLAKFQKKISKRIIHQLYQTQHYIYSQPSNHHLSYHQVNLTLKPLSYTEC